jgi:hypothetical protein
MDRFGACCLAFSADGTYERPGTETIRTMSRYDGSKRPDERVEITLLENKPLTEEQKITAAKIAGALFEKEGKGVSWMDYLKSDIKYGSCQMEANGNMLRYVFMRNRQPISYMIQGLFVGGNYRCGSKIRTEYEVDVSTGSFVAYKATFLAGMKVRDVFGTWLTLQEVYRTYSHAPDRDIPVSSTYQLRLRTPRAPAGSAGKTERIDKTIISDYRKVPCYRDRLGADGGEEGGGKPHRRG